MREESQVSVGTSFHWACRVGRLVEVRPERMHSVEGVFAISTAAKAVMRQVGTEGVYCMDWRRVRLLAPEVADALTALLKGGNARFLRSAVLIGGNATFALQMERVIKGADNPGRRAFRDADELLSWLGEVTTPEEQERARQFLLET